MIEPHADITVGDLKQRMDAGDDLFVIDVRERKEYEICRLEGARLMPMSEFANRVAELNDVKDREIIVHCRSGGRSAQVAQFMRKQGFANVRNLVGGVIAWAREIDPTMPTY
jgi:adenylyltransferase/sulfurtransferase